MSDEGAEGSVEATPSKICEVCSEPGSGVYFGAMVCLPCKSFYIRSTKDGDPQFTCMQSGSCEITKALRLRCQACRFNKCLAVGMARKEKPEVIEALEGQELCAVCGDIANGVHFGKHSCEGCKKFFRRGIKEFEEYECTKEKTCQINPRTRNSCKYCRYQKCVRVGMSREAIKMGRPKKKNSKAVQPKLETGTPSVQSVSSVPSTPSTPSTPSIPSTFPTHHLAPITLGAMEEPTGKTDKENLMLDLKTTLDFSSDLMPERSKYKEENEVNSFAAVPSPVTSHQQYSAHRVSASSSSSYSELTSPGPCAFTEQQTPNVRAPHQQNLLVGDADHHNVMMGDVIKQKLPIVNQQLSFADELEQQIAAVQQNFPAQHLDRQNSLEETVSGFNGYPAQSIGSSSHGSIGSSHNSMPPVMGQQCSRSPSASVTTPFTSASSHANSLAMLLNSANNAANGNSANGNAANDSGSLSSNCGNPWQRQTVSYSPPTPPVAPPQAPGPPNPIMMFGMSRIHADNCWGELLGKRYPAVASNKPTEKKAKLSKDGNLPKSMDYIGIPQNCIFTPPPALLDDEDVQVDPILVPTKQEAPPELEYVKVTDGRPFIEHTYWDGRACVPEGVEKLVDAHNSLFTIMETVLPRLLEMTDETKHADMKKEKQAQVQPNASKDRYQLIKDRIHRNCKAFLEFFSALPGHDKLATEDIRTSCRFGSFAGMILLSAVKRYDPVKNNFQSFWNYPVPPHSPVYKFKCVLLKYAQKIHECQIDDLELAFLIAMMLISGDLSTLQEPEIVHKIHSIYWTALKASMKRKGKPESHLRKILSLIIPVRELTAWHELILDWMKLEVNRTEMNTLFHTIKQE